MSKQLLELLPKKTAIAVFESELEPALCWAARHNVNVCRHGDLELRIELIQPETELPFYLRGTFESYKAIPPAWEFTDDKWESTSKSHMPSSVPGGIFHGNGLICAHFSRMAYKSYNNSGPHADWGELTLWENAGKPSEIRSRTISDMLQSIKRDFNRSRGYMK